VARREAERARVVAHGVVAARELVVLLVGTRGRAPEDGAPAVAGVAAPTLLGGPLLLGERSEHPLLAAEGPGPLLDRREGRAAGQARRAVVDGAVVGGAGRGAGPVVLPWRRARRHAADDGAEAGDLLVALAVAELVAAHPAVVAGGAGAVAGALR